MEELMFYQLDWTRSFPDPELANTDCCDDVGVPWTMGVRYDGVVPQPITCRLHPRSGQKMRDLFLTDIPLFSTRLLAAIQSAGIDNLQIYDSKILGLKGEIYTDYKAVNIVGTISCADLERSNYVSDKPSRFLKFTKLVIDDSRAKNHHFFSLGRRSVY